MFAGNVVYNNKMWIIAGGSTCAKAGLWKSDVWSSPNGTTWTRATNAAAFGIRYAMGAVVFNNQMFVIGGYNTSLGFVSDVWTSTNGSTWTEILAAAPFTPRFLFGCLVYNNRIWVIGGDNNDGVNPLADVWSSPDGINWTQAGNLPTPRSGASCVVFNGAMMVIGGGNASGAFNDVLTSTDGATWTEANPSAAFPPRSYAAAQVVNGTVWLMGGAVSSNFNAITSCLDDAWSSTDGVNWTERNATLPFWPRFSQESFSFNNEFWVVEGAWFAVGDSQTWNGSTGGSMTTTNEAFYPDDIWHTP